MSLFSGTGSIIENRELIRRPGFPIAILLAVTVISYFYLLNPMVTIVDAYRSVVIHAQFPEILPLLLVGLASVILLGITSKIFRKARYRFAEELCVIVKKYPLSASRSEELCSNPSKSLTLK
jgi:ABC-type polysaccharide/polyol phosphate export permease